MVQSWHNGFNIFFMNAIIIRGPLGVGKSTIAKMLASRFGGEYISVDQVLERHGLDKGVEGEGIPLSNFLKVNELIIQKAKLAISDEKIPVVDGNFYYKEQIDQLVSSLGDGVKVITLKASIQTCIERDAARPKPYGEDAVRAVHMFLSAFDYGTIIKTDDQAVDETMQSILGELVNHVG